MTELRDARLRKALEEAPDATLQPGQRTREAIQAAAHAAVLPPWRRWWNSAGERRMPWTAALATIALATLITLTWEGREPPGARREAADTVAGAPAPASAPVPAPVPVPVPAPVQPAPVPVQAPVARVRARVRVRVPGRVPTLAPVQAPARRPRCLRPPAAPLAVRVLPTLSLIHI